MPSLEIIGYLSIFVMGMTLGVIGAGGSILTVPILVYLFAISPTLATAYSLVLVGSTALTGGLKHIIQGNFDREALLVFGLPSVIGVYLSRRFFLPLIPENLGHVAEYEITRDGLIMLIFSGLMLSAALLMIRGRKTEESTATKSKKPHHFIAGCEGIVVGGITGMVGAGGGFLIVPVMTWLLMLPIRTAIATSLLIIAAKSLVGFIGDLQGSQLIDWRFLLSLLILSSLGILVGVQLGKKIPTTKLQQGFGWFVLVTGILIVGKELSG